MNLLVAGNLGKVSMDEVLRVLAPGGVALIGGKKTVKARSLNQSRYIDALADSIREYWAKEGRGDKLMFTGSDRNGQPVTTHDVAGLGQERP